MVNNSLCFDSYASDLVNNINISKRSYEKRKFNIQFSIKIYMFHNLVHI